jgi:hypothetical protein
MAASSDTVVARRKSRRLDRIITFASLSWRDVKIDTEAHDYRAPTADSEVSSVAEHEPAPPVLAAWNTAPLLREAVSWLA